MKREILLLLVVCAAHPVFAATYILTVAGLAGAPDHKQRFAALATDMDQVLRAGASTDIIVDTLKGVDATRFKVEAALNRIASQAKSEDSFALILIGHGQGTLDGEGYAFNTPGPAIRATELKTLMNQIPAGKQLVVIMTSSSGGAVTAFQEDCRVAYISQGVHEDTVHSRCTPSKVNRVIITTTNSSLGKDATVFARYWVEALRDPAADADKNETVSALEAFQYAEKKTNQFYWERKRLSAEPPQVDNSARAAVFPLLKVGLTSSVATDPAKRQLIAQEDDIEDRIDELKNQKSFMAPHDYNKQLQSLLLELSRVQEAIDK